MNIDNPKVRSLQPDEFAPFAGVTYLLDNPGDSLLTDPAARVQKVHCNESDPALNLYSGLSRLLTERGDDGRRFIDVLIADHNFAAIPFDGYHGTFCDSINASNVDRLGAKDQESITGIFSDLPRSLWHPDIDRLEPGPFPVPTIHFKFRELSPFAPAGALLAKLRPADPPSDKAFDALVAERERLNALSLQRTVAARRSWSPHVTLGYFGTMSATVQAEALCQHWSPKAERLLDGLTISFDQVSLYGFTDMANFWRRQP